MKSLIVLRSTYDTEVKGKDQIIEQQKDKIHNLQYIIEGLKRDIKTANVAIERVLPKLISIHEPTFNAEFDTYRLCVDIESKAIKNCFIHGNDDRIIEYFARRFSYQIERKIMQINFVRGKELI